MKRAIVLCALIAVGALSVGITAFQPPAQQGPKVVEVEKVKDNLFMLKGGGGNTAVFVTANGVTVVDAKNPGWGQPILDKIKELTPKPVTLLINTHTHGDHVSGNVDFPATVDIVVQENTKTNMEKMPIFKEHNGKGMPKKTFKDKMTLGRGKDQIDLYFFGAGHTSGDAFIVFPALRVLHTGDDFAWKDGPGCDRANGGSCVDLPRTLQKAIAGIRNVDTVIPGHSPITTPKDLETFQKFCADFLSHSIDAIKAGKSVDEALASFKIDKYPGYKNERLKGSIQAVYDELKK
jgi:cyclase